MGVSEVMYSYGLCVLSIILIILISCLKLKVAKNDLRDWCMLILVCALISNICTMFQILNISNYEKAIIYEALSCMGQAMLAVCQLFAILNFIKPKVKFTKRYLILFFIPILIIIAMFTNNYHHLVFEEFSNSFTECRYGVLFYVYVIYISIMYAISLFNLFKYVFKESQKYMNKILFGTIFILIPYLIQFLVITHVINAKVYITMVLQSITTISVIYILFKYHLLIELPMSLISILNTISEAFVVINKKGIIVRYNDIFLDMFDLGMLDIKGMYIKELIEFKEFDTISDKDIDKLLNIRNEKVYNFERTSNFLEKTLKYELKQLKMKNKDTYLISISDVTQYSKNIEDIKLNSDAIIGKERLASLGQMIGGIAHNLKTPIFSIAGAVEGVEDLVKEYKESIDDKNVTIEDHKEIAGEMREWTSKIKNYLSYMTDIITAIKMQISTDIEASIDQKFSVKELIKYIEILMKYELNHNQIDLRIDCRINKEKIIKGDINGLVQVMNNLISNAIQAYSNEKSKIIELSIYEKDEKILIEVRDYAGGIPEEIANKLFKEMITTKGKNGTGLRIIYFIYNYKNTIWRKFII